MAEMPQIPVSAVDRFLCHWNRDIMLFSIFNRIFSSCYFPFPPRSNNIEFRIQSKEGELKADLQKRIGLITVPTVEENAYNQQSCFNKDHNIASVAIKHT